MLNTQIPRTFPLLLPALLLALASATAQAQYKVVGPDGQVTYTDRPVPGAAARPVGQGAATAPAAELPYELRQAVSRYPATLYTASNCGPCDSARTLLRQRGIPVTEYRVERAEDIAELQRREGGVQLPVLRLGGQRLQGFEAGDWQATLDAAGYPRSSRLPPTWRATPAQPLVPEVAEAPRDAAPTRTAPAPVVLPAPTSGRFRF